MSTAEFIIDHSADDAAERKQEVRKVLWAFLAALFLHLLVAFSLAAWSGALSPAFPAEEKPIELTFVDLATPAPVIKDVLPTIDLKKSKESPVVPKEKDFQANVNLIAASEEPPTGSLPLPSHDEKQRPINIIEDQEYTPANRGMAAPTVESQEQPRHSPQPQETASHAKPESGVEQFALLTSTPNPMVQPSTQVQPSVQPTMAPQPAQELQRQKKRTKVAGSISNRGPASVNAVGTPLGRYAKIIYDSIGSRFRGYSESRMDLLAFGTVSLHFVIDRSGRIKDLKLLNNTSNEAMANLCLQAVQEAQLPPMPDDLAATLPPEGLEWEPDFILFPQ